MSQEQGVIRRATGALRRAAGMLRTIGLAALLLPALVAQAQTTSSTSLGTSLSPSAYGQSVTLTATVTGDNPSGAITFKDGSTTLGTGTLSSGVATLSVSSLSVGTHSLTAEYTGDTNNTASSSSALSQVVNQVSTTSAVTSSLNPSTYNANVTFTATVTGSAPTGSVTFMDGATTLGSGTLAGTGNSRTTTLVVGTLAVGAHSITVVYGGDSNNATSTSSALSQTVNKASSTSAVTSSLNPSTFNANVTFTATVTGRAPTGDVTFKDGTTVLGTGTLGGTGNSRTTTLATSALSIAAHSITIVYAGDGNNATSTSAVLIQTVNKYTTTIALTSSANPSAYNQSITLTATVGGGSSPTGTVTFKDGTTTLATVNLTGNVATYSLSNLSAASHSLTAVYNGDATNNTSTSTAVSQVVNKYTSSTTLTSSVNPGTAGQSLTLTATVSGVTPMGLITFKDGTTTLGTATLGSGVATLNYSAWSGGSHSLTAVYAGDTNNATSTSSALSQSFNPTAPTLVLSVSSAIASQGQNVTLTAKVVGGYLPSGLVTFSSAAGPQGTASVNGGAATFSINNLGVGSHTLSASYAGDSSNQGASSGSVSLTVNPRAGLIWQYGYDAMGRINTMVDPNGLVTYIYYDSLGRPIQTQEPPNTGSVTPTITSFAYNAADSLTKVTDPRSLETTYTPNGLRDVTAQTSPDTGASQYTYDANGNVLTKTDARGKLTQYAYDSLNRLTGITYPTGTPTVIEYDGGSTPTPAAVGELTKISDTSGQTSYGYDSLGRKTSKTVVTNGKTFVTGYSWGDTGSALDKLTGITYPSGSRVNYSYDVHGTVSAITVNPVNANGVGTSATVMPLLSGITSNAENKLTGWTWASTKPQAISYDSVGQIESYNLGDASGTGTAAGIRRTVLRDSAGRITGYTHANNGVAVPALDQSFTYDNLNRLVSATLVGTAIQYSYDATGNRTAKVISGTSYANTVSATSNKLTQTQDITGTASVVHDAAGNITIDGTNTYTYSDRGRLATMTNAGGTVTYAYNAPEQRVSKTGPTALVPTGATYYIYDEEGKLLGEYDASGTPLYETIYLGSPVGVMKLAGSAANSNIAVSLYNVSTDQIGAPRVITRQSDEAVVWRWDAVEPFGVTAPDQNPAGLGAFTFNQRLPGQVFDAESGLFQNWNREYNPRIGRYMQSDPIGLEGGINTYSYVGGDPLSFMDPTGLDRMCGPGSRAISTGQSGVYRCEKDGGDPNAKICVTAECAAGLPKNSSPVELPCCDKSKLSDCLLKEGLSNARDCTLCALSRGQNKPACAQCALLVPAAGTCFAENCSKCESCGK